MSKCSGKVAVITGGSSGIGLATASLLQAEGGHVVVTGRDAATLAQARTTLGERALAVQSDTSSLSAIDALVITVKQRHDHVDLLFINAGIAQFSPLEAVDEKFWDTTMNINTKGAFFTVQKFLPLLKPGSSIVLTTSIVDQKGMASTAVYSASKAALRSLVRTFAGELVERGIRVNAVSPGPIVTPIFGKMGMAPADLDGFAEGFRQQNPMKRFGTADEVAKAVLYLAVDATYTTGAELVVDGGLSQL